MRSDGTEVQRLPGRGRTLSLVWSPDGRRLAFSTKGLRVIDWRRGTVRKLTDFSAGPPAWSPDGRRIAFGGVASDTGSVYVVRADGSKLRRLHRGYGPEWSPDGRRITFDSDRHVKVMDADGRHVQTLAAGGSPEWFGPAPTRTKLNVAPARATKGARLTVTGNVTKVGIALPGASVTIRFKATGARGFTTTSTATTNTNGRFKVTATAQRTGKWKAVHAATAATLASSATDKVTVRRR